MILTDVFSSRLRILRANRGISFRDLGNVLGVSDEAVRLMERGKRYPSYESLIALADFFDVPIDFLTGRRPFENWEVIQAQMPSLLPVMARLVNLPVATLERLSLSGLIRLYAVLFSRIEFNPDTNSLTIFPLILPSDTLQL